MKYYAAIKSFSTMNHAVFKKNLVFKLQLQGVVELKRPLSIGYIDWAMFKSKEGVSLLRGIMEPFP